MEATDWDRVKAVVPIGSEVSGQVVGHLPSGVFVGLGLGFLGQLELPEFADPAVRSRGQCFPPLGAPLTARVLQHVDHNQQLRLTQRTLSEEEWEKVRVFLRERPAEQGASADIGRDAGYSEFNGSQGGRRC